MLRNQSEYEDSDDYDYREKGTPRVLGPVEFFMKGLVVFLVIRWLFK